MSTQLLRPPGAPEFTSDLTRKLVNDADLVTRLAPSVPLLGEDASDAESEMLTDLISHYETLDGETRKDLRDLAAILNDDQGQALRAVVCRPGHAQITISPDSMAAHLTVYPPEGGGRVTTAQDIVEQLKGDHISFGVDMAVIVATAHEAARAAKPVGPVLIAAGRPPVTGLPGRVVPEIGEVIPSTPGTKRTQQWMVKARDVLARMVPPTAGEDGATVFGVPLPATTGTAAILETGEGVQVDQEAGTYVAALDGLASFDGQTMEVRRQLVWPGDLTSNDPQLEFDGSILVQGTVRDGARVSATGDIEIRGGVEAATVISRDGTVVVRQGVAGRDCGFISAKTIVDVRFLEHAIVYCAGDVLVRHAMIHSRVTVGKNFAADMGKGVLFGGEVRAGLEIRAKSFGNSAGIATRLSVGHDWASLEQLREQEAVLATLTQHHDACERVITQFRHARPDIERLTQTERQALSAVIRRNILLKARIAEQRKKYDELDAAWTLTGKGRVIALEGFSAGVTVKMGSTITRIDMNLPACTLSFQAEKQKITAKNSFGRDMRID